MAEISCSLSDYALGWVVGLLEGEGSFVVASTGTRDPRSPCISVGSTDQDVIIRIHEVLGTGHVGGPYESLGLGTKPYWRWSTASRDDAVDLALALKPHMSRRRQGQLDKIIAWDVVTPRRYRYGARGSKLGWRTVDVEAA